MKRDKHFDGFEMPYEEGGSCSMRCAEYGSNFDRSYAIRYSCINACLCKLACGAGHYWISHTCHLPVRRDSK